MNDNRIRDIDKALEAINKNIDKIKKEKIVQNLMDLEPVLNELKKARDDNPWDPKFRELNDRVNNTKISLNNALTLKAAPKSPTSKVGFTLDEKAREFAKEWKESGSWYLTKVAIQNYAKEHKLSASDTQKLMVKTQQTALKIVEHQNKTNRRSPR